MNVSRATERWCTVMGRLVLGLGLITPVLLAPMTMAKEAEPESAVKVEIDGVSGELLNNIRSFLEVARLPAGDAITADVRRAHGLAPSQIVRALEPFGHYRPQIDANLEAVGDGWLASYIVDPGPLVAVGQLHFELAGAGQNEPVFVALVDQFPMTPGTPLVHSSYELAKERFLVAAAARGYLDAEFTTRQVTVDLEAYAANLDLRFDTGPRFLFGQVEFLQAVVEPEILQGYVLFAAGEPYDTAALLKLQADLRQSDLWSSVVVDPRRDRATDLRVPIEVRLTPRARRRDAFGLGYSTDTGPRLSGTFEFRRLNKRGHRARLEAKVSELDRALAFQYVIPRAESEEGILRFDGGHDQRETDTFDADISFIGGAMAKKRDRWQKVWTLRFERHDFTVGSDSGVVNLLMPGAQFSWVRSDDRLFPRHGGRFDIELRGGAEDVGSDVSFVRLHARGRWLRAIGERWRLLTRGELGATWTSDFRLLPPAIRFFAGGDESVRGFDFQALGPRDDAGQVVGGDGLATLSLELEWRVFGDWGVAAFADIGNAFDDLQGEWSRGVGTGLRWFSPIGLVRADVAWAVSEPGSPTRLHFGLGLTL